MLENGLSVVLNGHHCYQKTFQKAKKELCEAWCHRNMKHTKLSVFTFSVLKIESVHCDATEEWNLKMFSSRVFYDSLNSSPYFSWFLICRGPYMTIDIFTSNLEYFSFSSKPSVSQVKTVGAFFIICVNFLGSTCTIIKFSWYISCLAKLHGHDVKHY